MNRIEYLQHEYDDAKTQWWTAGSEELQAIRDRMLRLSDLAEGWLGDDGLPLAEQMHLLAAGIDARLSQRESVI